MAPRAFATFVFPVFLVSLSLLVGGCGGPPPVANDLAAPGASTAALAEPAVAPAAATPAAPAAAPPSTALVWVNGMGCPLCATNVDQQLRRVPGVTAVTINLGTGIVSVGLDPTQPPAESALARAVEDSGFTLVRIQMPAATGGGA